MMQQLPILQNDTSCDVRIDKFENAVLYFLEHCNNDYLGKTKLNKLLYYLDFISFRDRGYSVTLDEYIHLDYGPVPMSIDKVLFHLNEAEDIAISEISTNDGRKFRFYNKKSPNMDLFDDYEKAHLKIICDTFETWSTDKIVNQTHVEAPWLYSAPFGLVDFNNAYDIDFFRGDDALCHSAQ